MFTPLFTIALGSLPKDLYSHGSAVVGTVQQVAGAFGTAVFVTAMASQSAAAQASGTPVEAALLIGSRVAFLGAGAVWTLAIIATLFIRAPELRGDEPTTHH
jgi:DHA2 family lincomycin resistance protein-like MFS transporter